MAVPCPGRPPTAATVSARRVRAGAGRPSVRGTAGAPRPCCGSGSVRPQRGNPPYAAVTERIDRLRGSSSAKDLEVARPPHAYAALPALVYRQFLEAGARSGS